MARGRSTSEPAAKKMTTRDRLYHRAARTEYSQRLRPSYTVSPAGQPLKRRRPAPGAAQAVGRTKKTPAEAGAKFTGVPQPVAFAAFRYHASQQETPAYAVAVTDRPQAR